MCALSPFFVVVVNRRQQGPESVCVAAVCSAGRVIHHLEARIEPGSGLMDVRSV